MILFRSFAFLTQNFLFVLAGIVGISFLIGFHELGHYLFCKLFNIRTPSFSIGFGPRLLTKKIGETEFALSAIPLGGYVEIAGSAELGQGEQKESHSKDKRSFAVKPYYQKMLVMFGGILFNLIFAYFALILLFMLGIPKPVATIRSVQPDSAAQKQFNPGDQIIAINQHMVENDYEKLLTIIKPLANQEVSILINRNNQEITIPFALESKKDVHGNVIGSLKGVTFAMANSAGVSFFEAVKKGISFTNKFILETLKIFKNIFSHRDSLQGPVGIISTMIDGLSQSFNIFLLLLAIISINLAVLNLVPLPILDGGQILYYTIEAIIGRPIPIKIREYIHIVSWLLVLGLILYLSAQDIYKMIKPLLVKIMSK